LEVSVKRNPVREALADSAQRQIAELMAALEKSTRGLIADAAAEAAPERDRWARRVLQRIRMLSGLAPAAQSSHGVPNPPSRSPGAKPSNSPAAVNSLPPASALPTATNQKSRAQIRQEKREAAKAAKEKRKNFERILRASEIAFPSFDRMRAAVPDLDPIRQLQEVKDRAFSTG
jgi:hypothetical protein